MQSKGGHDKAGLETNLVGWLFIALCIEGFKRDLRELVIGFFFSSRIKKKKQLQEKS